MVKTESSKEHDEVEMKSSDESWSTSDEDSSDNEYSVKTKSDKMLEEEERLRARLKKRHRKHKKKHKKRGKRKKYSKHRSSDSNESQDDGR